MHQIVDATINVAAPFGSEGTFELGTSVESAVYYYNGLERAEIESVQLQITEWGDAVRGSYEVVAGIPKGGEAPTTEIVSGDFVVVTCPSEQPLGC